MTSSCWRTDDVNDNLSAAASEKLGSNAKDGCACYVVFVIFA